MQYKMPIKSRVFGYGSISHYIEIRSHCYSFATVKRPSAGVICYAVLGFEGNYFSFHQS